MATRKTAAKATVKAENASAPDKAANFKKLASKRVPNAIRAIRSVGKLAAKSGYEYTEEQQQKVIAALRDEVDTIEQWFADGKVPKETVSFDV